MQQHEVQPEEFLEVKSPIDRLREQWKAEKTSLGFVRQIKLLRQKPELVQYAELARLPGWTPALIFALQGILVIAVLLSAANWMLTKDRCRQADEIVALKADVETEMKRLDGVVAAARWEISRVKKSFKTAGFTVATSGPTLTKEAALQRLDDLIQQTQSAGQEYKTQAEIKEKQLRAQGDALTLARSGTPLVFALALIFAAQLFRRSAYSSYSLYKLARQADEFYLYYLVGQALWMICALIVLLHLGLSSYALGLGGMADAIGPIGAIVFWLAVYALLLFMFFSISKDLYKAMQIRAPRDLADITNKLLLKMHNSFWMVFAAFETGLLALCYVTYFIAMH